MGFIVIVIVWVGMYGFIDAIGRLHLSDEERLTTFAALTIASSIILLLIFPDFSY
jgi:DNA-directed RNA polymerase specialized sigma subunit